MLLQDGSTLSDARTTFEETGYVVVRGFLDIATVTTVSKVIEYGFRQGLYAERTATERNDLIANPSQYLRYAEPIVEVILENSTDEIASLVGKSVVPTYSYSRIYTKGDKLIRHTDRPSCEYSVTVHVATVGELWPIWMQKEGGPPTKVVLYPGDAVVYKGCEIAHWRDPMVDCDVNVQFMLHYVDEGGAYAAYKWDKRPGLGYLDTSRRP